MEHLLLNAEERSGRTPSMTQKAARAGIVLAISSLLLAGCGQKGDLYLPKQSVAPHVTQWSVDLPHVNS